MLLAAGRGERLRPLTDVRPKALVEVGGTPLIAWHLQRLAQAGCREAVVNVSHLGEQIVETIGDGTAFGLSVAYSREPAPLETAGGIAQALGLLGAEPFLLVNADIYCERDFAPLLRMRLEPGRMGHLVLVPNPGHRPKGDFTLQSGLVRGLPQDPGSARYTYTYAGLAVLSPALVGAVRPGDKAPLAPFLYGAADRGELAGELYDGLWQDVGTLERLAELQTFLATRNAHR